MEQQLCRD